ncbi:MAG TPA: hypothetical protein DD407_14210, partial [Pseudohongiella sp.]|nr:hypothetical protein [Pseudohongiella sp.]
MIRTVRRITSLFVILTALTGCVLVPGSNIDPDQYSTETQADWFEVNRGVWFPGLRGIGQADTEEDVAAVER